MSNASIQELLELSERLLNAITSGDWDTYQQLCDPMLSAFEPEARGHLVEGLDFHHYYFQLADASRPVQNTMAAPRIRMLGDDAAVVCCVRLIQYQDSEGATHTKRFEETRIWQRQDGRWRHVHFHRSANP